MNIFANYGPKYYESGFSIIPTLGKHPPKGFDNYQEYSDHLPEENLIEDWYDKYANANVSIMLGKASGIIALDFDYEGPDYEQVENIVLGLIPPTPVSKVGRRGWTKFYRYNGEISTKKDRSGVRFFDLLSDSKYTVIPPSIHPDTGKGYKWTGDSLLDYSQIDLPQLGNDVVDKLKMLAEMDLVKGENPFAVKSGRHDRIMGYAWKIIEHVSSVDELAQKILDYDVSVNGEQNYFTDRKYFKGKNKSALDNALYTAKKFEKSAVRWRKKKFGVVWEIGKKLSSDFFSTDIASEFYSTEINDAGKEVVKPLYRNAGNYLKSVGDLVFDDAFTYKFNGKYWETLSETGFFNYVTKCAPQYWQPQHFINFRKSISSACCYDKNNFIDINGHINLKNGVFNVGTKILSIHSNKYFFKNLVDVEYNQSAKCPHFLAWLKDRLDGDEQLMRSVQKMFGYVIMGGDPFLHLAFVLYGSGRNGKSTLLNILRKLLGTSSYSVVSLAKLHKEFSSVNLDGKLANIVEETPTDAINSEIFKTCVGGGELQVAHKGRDEYSIKVNARFVFACNEMPIFKDKSEGLIDRLFFIPFNKYIQEGERDFGINEKLEAELSGILNWAIDGIEIVKKERMVQPDASKELKNSYLEESDSVYAWYKSSVEVKSGMHFVFACDLYIMYKLYCEAQGSMALGERKFYNRLKQQVKKDCSAQGIPFNDKEVRDRGNVRNLRVYNMLSVNDGIKNMETSVDEYRRKKNNESTKCF